MRILRSTNKAYSLVMWTATFTALLAAVALIQVPLKRALRPKVRATADYVLWTSWSNDAKLEPTEKTSRAKSISAGYQHSFVNEKHADADFPNSTGGILRYGAINQRNETRVSSGVEEGSEVLLNEFDLN